MQTYSPLVFLFLYRINKKPGGCMWPTKNVTYSSQLPSMFVVSKRKKR